MRKLSIVGVVIVLVLGLAAVLATKPAALRPPPRPASTQPFRPTIAIAPLGEALTFARFGNGEAARTLAVTRYQNGVVSGVDLTSLIRPGEDAIALYNRIGYGVIEAFVANSSATVSRDAATLAVPADLRGVHAAVATNYPEHADEADVDDGPFMFAKVAQPTASRAKIPAVEGLLDYEVELCLVTLAPLRAAAGAAGGLMLCNDVTDRAALLRSADLSNIASGNGFTNGKSGAGFLPVGDLFVIPRNLEAFIKPMELQLSVNGEERQRTPTTRWIWNFDRQLTEIARRQGVRWNWREGTAQLPISNSGIIPDRTLVLAGTPAGTIFQSPDISTMILGTFDWVATFGQRSITKQIVERTIADGKASGAYLRSGDAVTIRVDRMGALDNRVQLAAR